MSFNFFILFSITVFVASIIPGPSMLLALTHGMNYGAKKSIVSALGNLTVTLIQATVSIIGLGTVLIASETVFQVVKFAGSAYLIYMGINMFVFSKKAPPEKKFESEVKSYSLKKMYLQSVFVTAGNPKAIIFFTAVFPQFINPDADYASQFLIMLSGCSVIAFSCFMIYAVGGQKIAAVFSGEKLRALMQKIVGSAFISAGITLALSHKR